MEEFSLLPIETSDLQQEICVRFIEESADFLTLCEGFAILVRKISLFSLSFWSLQ